MDQLPNLLPLLVLCQFAHSALRTLSGLRNESLSSSTHTVVSPSKIVPTDVIGAICRKNLESFLGIAVLPLTTHLTLCKFSVDSSVAMHGVIVTVHVS